jgi:hypothetical protein
MKNRGIAFVLLTSLALLVSATPGCDKFHDDFSPSGPTTSTTPPPSDPMPADLVGTWISQSAVAGTRKLDPAEVFRNRYQPDAGALRLRFTLDGKFLYQLLDTSMVVIEERQGAVTLHGDHMTCTVKPNIFTDPNETEFNIIDDTWSLHENQLVLPYEIGAGVDEGEDISALVTYRKR